MNGELPVCWHTEHSMSGDLLWKTIFRALKQAMHYSSVPSRLSKNHLMHTFAEKHGNVSFAAESPHESDQTGSELILHKHTSNCAVCILK
jgi:hypothetical protein